MSNSSSVSTTRVVGGWQGLDSAPRDVVTQPTQGKRFTVPPGGNLGTVLQRAGLDPKDAQIVARMNGLANANIVRAGSTLYIPTQRQIAQARADIVANEGVDATRIPKPATQRPPTTGLRPPTGGVTTGRVASVEIPRSRTTTIAQVDTFVANLRERVASGAMTPDEAVREVSRYTAQFPGAEVGAQAVLNGAREGFQTESARQQHNAAIDNGTAQKPPTQTGRREQGIVIDETQPWNVREVDLTTATFFAENVLATSLMMSPDEFLAAASVATDRQGRTRANVAARLEDILRETSQRLASPAENLTPEARAYLVSLRDKAVQLLKTETGAL